MDVIAVIALALAAACVAWLAPVRRRVAHLEDLVMRMQDRLTALEHAPAGRTAAQPATPIDTDPFVD